MSHIHLRAPSSASARRASQSLPKFYSDKPHYHSRSFTPWIIHFSVVIPGARRRLRLWVPNIRGLHRASLSKFGKKRGFFLIVLAYGFFIFSIFAVAHRFGSKKKTWPGVPSTTLVFEKEDLWRMYEWEIKSGHHPSTRPIPAEFNIQNQPKNPALPHAGANRVYLDGQNRDNVAYPSRPKLGSIADLDVLMRHCDFSTSSYVRDCLEVLRVGGGLDNGKRVRRVVPEEWKYVFVQDSNPGRVSTPTSPSPLSAAGDSKRQGVVRGEHDAESNNAFTKSRHAVWETSPISLPPVKNPLASPYCDPEQPRIFHMFWSGDLTDKPYLALLSFLYTQNLGLHETGQPRDLCAPKLWLWVNPGFMLTVKNPSLSLEKFERIKRNQWAAPFLHPRFKDLIEIKFWNTTERLDGVPELRDVWRTAPTLFNSGGHTIYVPGMPKAWGVQEDDTTTAIENQGNNTSSSTVYSEPEKVAVVLSDMARFLLCHEFGGVYLDADTLFLRDWEELWNWKGAFAYRWSWHDDYNTAALKMTKGSALGSLILRTAYRNDFDFHPMTITNYMKDAHMEDLLFRLPDAMFDSAWLNMEGYQRERPPQPYFNKFEEFFETPQQNSATPVVVGFDGFFRGAFSYHFHNSWSRLNDPARNYPDLGPRFARDVDIFIPKPDPQDFNWSTVLKRTFEAYLRGEIPNMYGEWIKY